MFGCPFTIFFARCYICPLIHNILCPLSSPVEIVDSISLPVDRGKYIIRPLSLETDARFVFELDKEWGSMPPDK